MCATSETYQTAAVFISLASLLVSVAAVLIGKSTLSQAKQVADRDLEDWKQRKWFDLYIKANEAYDSMDRFQSLYYLDSRVEVYGEDFNALMSLFREVHGMAAVFPRNSVTDELFASTGVFGNPQEALSKDRKAKVFDAVEHIREKALLRNAAILG